MKLSRIQILFFLKYRPQHLSKCFSASIFTAKELEGFVSLSLTNIPFNAKRDMLTRGKAELPGL